MWKGKSRRRFWRVAKRQIIKNQVEQGGLFGFTSKITSCCRIGITVLSEECYSESGKSREAQTSTELPDLGNVLSKYINNFFN